MCRSNISRDAVAGRDFQCRRPPQVAQSDKSFGKIAVSDKQIAAGDKQVADFQVSRKAFKNLIDRPKL